MARLENRLLVGASDHEADLLYACGLLTREPLIWLDGGGGRPVLVAPAALAEAARKKFTGFDVRIAAEVVPRGRHPQAPGRTEAEARRRAGEFSPRPRPLAPPAEGEGEDPVALPPAASGQVRRRGE
jgi:hypothetical protein